METSPNLRLAHLKFPPPPPSQGAQEAVARASNSLLPLQLVSTSLFFMGVCMCMHITLLRCTPPSGLLQRGAGGKS